MNLKQNCRIEFNFGTLSTNQNQSYVTIVVMLKSNDLNDSTITIN
jgi:hypothetical protein